MPRPLRDLPASSLPTSWQEHMRANCERMMVRRVASGPIGGGRAVVSSGVATVAYATSQLAIHMHLFLGVTTGAAAAGDKVDVVVSGLAEDSAWAFTTGLPVFVSPAQGVLTQTPPSSPGSLFALRIGVALSPTSVFVRPSIPMALI